MHTHDRRDRPMSTDDGPDRRTLAIRSALAEYLPVIMLVAVLLLAAGGWITYGAYVDPGTETTQETVGTLEYSGSFEQGATVQRQNLIFPVGTRLEDQPVYFTNISPTLSGAYTLDLTTNGLDSARAEVTVSRVIQSTTGEDTVIWSDSRRLGETTGVGGGETSVRFAVTVPEAADRIATIEESLGGGTGETSVELQAETTLVASAAGQTKRTTTTQALQLSPDDQTYSVNAPESDGGSLPVTVTQTVPRTPSLLERAGGPLVILLGLTGLGVSWRARQQGQLALTEEERAYRAYRDDYREFEEWITTIALPATARDLPEAPAESLGDLVDYAIDTDSAVIEHPETGTFSVIHDGTRYVYQPPPTPADRSLTEALGLDRSAGDDDADTSEEPDEDTATSETDLDADSFEWSEEDNE